MASWCARSALPNLTASSSSTGLLPSVRFEWAARSIHPASRLTAQGRRRSQLRLVCSPPLCVLRVDSSRIQSVQPLPQCVSTLHLVRTQPKAHTLTAATSTLEPSPSLISPLPRPNAFPVSLSRPKMSARSSRFYHVHLSPSSKRSNTVRSTIRSCPMVSAHLAGLSPSSTGASSAFAFLAVDIVQRPHRSEVVGRPLAALLANDGARVFVSTNGSAMFGASALIQLTVHRHRRHSRVHPSLHVRRSIHSPSTFRQAYRPRSRSRSPAMRRRHLRRSKRRV